MIEDINLLLNDTNEKFEILFMDLDKFKNADLAMYEIKRNGGNGYKIYSSEFNGISTKPTVSV